MQRNGWAGVRAWLLSSDSDWFHDDAVYGALTADAIADLLQDFGIAPTRAAIGRVWVEVDTALTTGRR